MATGFFLIGVVLIIYVGYRLYRHVFPPPNINPIGKYVLVTGCDSGFGHALSIELDKQGFNVFAAVYNPDNKEHLSSQLSSRAIVLSLDITQQDEIDAAFEIVRRKTKVLHALINNAGIFQTGFIDWRTVDVMKQIMDVNLFGHVAMTKTFLPLLISKRGSRVVNIGSIAGYLVLPSMSAYACSTFALEAFSDGLRREMYPWGLHVSIIEPGYMRTPILEGHDNELRTLWSELSDDTKIRWGNEFFNSVITKSAKNPFVTNAENPFKTIKAIRHSVMSTEPRIRYRPGWQSSLFWFPLSCLPSWLTDLILIKLDVSDVLPASALELQN